MTEVELAVVRGDFEGHITIRACEPGTVVALERYAAQHDMKFTHIVLMRGRMPDQPMVTVRRSGTLVAVREWIDTVVVALSAAGFEVARVKLEATPWAEGVPSTDEAAKVLGSRYYFEHHIKLLLPVGAGPEDAAATVAGHQAHVSANARRARPDGRTERFVTQRCRAVGNQTAEARLADLLAVLTDYRVLSVEREFVVYDTNESADEGWIIEPAVAP
ncbi:hypothetical protein OH799_14285 [Nocardia sp. NBC_00881]|uniref:hypothetical protein n=1 Tax=Nocardia sp. NBC_00881 TaxID=2975995 RepID=UPI003870BC41|nr:hypothetical protein OH799_14285 [Nocardia sp. NBC_00881]